MTVKRGFPGNLWRAFAVNLDCLVVLAKVLNGIGRVLSGSRRKQYVPNHHTRPQPRKN